MVALFKSKSRQEAAKTKKEEIAKAKETRRQLELEHPNARFAATQVTYTDATFEHPPPLNYSLRTRKKPLLIFWTLIFLDCVCMPIVLYFTLWYATSLSHNAVFSISTGALGTVSIVEYFIRFRRLWRRNSNCRVIGARRYYVCRNFPYFVMKSSLTTCSSISFIGISQLPGWQSW
jgi:hypothetical protein